MCRALADLPSDLGLEAVDKFSMASLDTVRSKTGFMVLPHALQDRLHGAQMAEIFPMLPLFRMFLPLAASFWSAVPSRVIPFRKMPCSFQSFDVACCS